MEKHSEGCRAFFYRNFFFMDCFPEILLQVLLFSLHRKQLFMGHADTEGDRNLEPGVCTLGLMVHPQ